MAFFKGIAQGMTTVVRSADVTHPDSDTEVLLNIEGVEAAMDVFVRVN